MMRAPMGWFQVESLEQPSQSQQTAIVVAPPAATSREESTPVVPATPATLQSKLTETLHVSLVICCNTSVILLFCTPLFVATVVIYAGEYTFNAIFSFNFNLFIY